MHDHGYHSRAPAFGRTPATGRARLWGLVVERHRSQAPVPRILHSQERADCYSAGYLTLPEGNVHIPQGSTPARIVAATDQRSPEDASGAYRALWSTLGCLTARHAQSVPDFTFGHHAQRVAFDQCQPIEVRIPLCRFLCASPSPHTPCEPRWPSRWPTLLITNRHLRRARSRPKCVPWWAETMTSGS